VGETSLKIGMDNFGLKLIHLIVHIKIYKVDSVQTIISFKISLYSVRSNNNNNNNENEDDDRLQQFFLSFSFYGKLAKAREAVGIQTPIAL
jgi:hypothetical protein